MQQPLPAAEPTVAASSRKVWKPGCAASHSGPVGVLMPGQQPLQQLFPAQVLAQQGRQEHSEQVLNSRAPITSGPPRIEGAFPMAEKFSPRVCKVETCIRQCPWTLSTPGFSRDSAGIQPVINSIMVLESSSVMAFIKVFWLRRCGTILTILTMPCEPCPSFSPRPHLPAREHLRSAPPPDPHTGSTYGTDLRK